MKKLIPAVGCLRMSSDKQDTSIDDQKTAIIGYSERNGYRMVRWYIDEAISGDTDSRPGFKALVKDVQTVRDFDFVLVWDQERFSRMDILDVAAYWKILRDADVKILAVKDSREIDFNTMAGVLVACINQHGAHDYLKTLSKNVSRGHTSAAKAGCWAGSKVPDGYKSVDAVIDGKKRKRLHIDENRAPIIRQMFSDFLHSDMSYRGIASRLNARGILNHTGCCWTDQGVQSILKNEVYVGTIIRGRRAAGKYTRTTAGQPVEVSRKLHRVTKGGKVKAKVVEQDRRDWLVCDHAHDAIIDSDMFHLVQAKMEVRRSSRRKPRKGASLLAGLLYCGHCGSRAKAHGLAAGGFIRCTAASPGSGIKGPVECCCCFPYEAVVEAVLQDVENERLSEQCIQEWRAEVSKVLLEGRSTRAENETALKSSIAAISQKLDKAQKRLMDVDDDMVETLQVQIRELRDKKQSAESQLAAQARIGSITEGAVATDTAKYIATLRTCRSKIRSASVEEARAALAAIVDRIELISEPAKPEKRAHTKRRQFKSFRVHYKRGQDVIAQKIGLPDDYQELLCQSKGKSTLMLAQSMTVMRK